MDDCGQRDWYMFDEINLLFFLGRKLIQSEFNLNILDYSTLSNKKDSIVNE